MALQHSTSRRCNTHNRISNACTQAMPHRRGAPLLGRVRVEAQGSHVKAVVSLQHPPHSFATEPLQSDMVVLKDTPHEGSHTIKKCSSKWGLKLAPRACSLARGRYPGRPSPQAWCTPCAGAAHAQPAQQHCHTQEGLLCHWPRLAAVGALPGPQASVRPCMCFACRPSNAAHSSFKYCRHLALPLSIPASRQTVVQAAGCAPCRLAV